MRPGTSARHAVALVAVVVLAAFYLGPRLDLGMIPHDEGLLAGTAERVLDGELPHRDFTDPYTGGLAFLHAAALRLFGVRLVSLRILLLFAGLLFVAAFYRLAARTAGPPAAAFLSLVAVVWSLPNYFAAMPSWYNLFFSVFGALALVRHLETGGRRWAAVAGLCGGLSVLVKSTGMLFVAAGLLVLVHRAQEGPSEDEAPPTDGGRLYRAFVVAGLAAFALGLAALVWGRRTAGDLFFFVLPGAVLAAYLMARELRRPGGARWRRLLEPGAVFLAGVAVPVALFLVPYALSGGLGALAHGLFEEVWGRLAFAAFEPPPPWTAVAALPVLGLYFLRLGRRAETFVVGPVALLLLFAATFGFVPRVYAAVWLVLRPLAPLVVLLGAWRLARLGDDSGRRQRLFLVLAMTALWNVVQFPYAHGIYFCYVAPWVVLALAEVAATTPTAPRRLQAAVMLAASLFAALWLNRGTSSFLGSFYVPAGNDAELALDRGGLRVPRQIADVFDRLVPLVRAHSAEGSYVYAAPDCPEVYFLSGRRNPTRTTYDFFDEDFGDPEARTRRILGQLEEHDVQVVVLNWKPEFSLGVERALARALTERYPHSATVEPFTVHWREAEASPP